MNIRAIVPPPNIGVAKPIKISPQGNLYKIQVNHKNLTDASIKNFEVWATKEAIQQHFDNMTDEPKEYQLKKFARQMYEKQLRVSGGQLQHQGILVTTDKITHGNPLLWPHTISHPEVKM